LRRGIGIRLVLWTPTPHESQRKPCGNPPSQTRSQALLIEKLRHQLAGHLNHRFGTSSETIEQLQLALKEVARFF
jgi:hypothetical protein